MIYFSIPYSFTQRLFQAFDHEINRLPNDDDWIVMLDGDTAFLMPDFGHHVEYYVKKYPDTGLFTCYASRCHYECQRVPGADPENPDIRYHRKIAEQQSNLIGQVEELDRRIAGHMMVIQKRVWKKIRPTVAEKTKEKHILGVDTKISNAIRAHGYKIRLMKSIYLLHYLRMNDGKNDFIK